MQKKNEKVCGVKKKTYLCIVKIGTGSSDERLDYGVMVTQQILVLFFQVRVLVVQLKEGSSQELPFLFVPTPYNKKEGVKHPLFVCHSLIDSSITAIFCTISSRSAFNFSTFRFISVTKLFPFFEALVRKPKLFSYV